MPAVGRRGSAASWIAAVVLLVLAAVAVLPSGDTLVPSAAPIRTAVSRPPEPGARDSDDGESDWPDGPAGSAETAEKTAGTVLLGRGPRSPRAAARLPAADWLRCAAPVQGVQVALQAASWTAEPVFDRAVVDAQSGRAGDGGNWTNFCSHGGALVVIPLTDGASTKACVCPRRTAGARCERLLPIDPGSSDALEAAENPDFGVGLDDDLHAIGGRVMVCAGCPWFWSHGFGQEPEAVFEKERHGLILEDGSFIAVDSALLARHFNETKPLVVQSTDAEGRAANATLPMPTWVRAFSAQSATLRAVLARRRESHAELRQCMGSATDALLCLVAWGDPRGGGELRVPATTVAAWAGVNAPGLEGHYLGLNASCLGSETVDDASLYGPWGTENDARYLHQLSLHTLRPLSPPPNSTDFLYCIFVTEHRIVHTDDNPDHALLILLALLPSHYTPLRNKYAIHVDLKSRARFRHSIELAAEALALANARAGRPRNLWVIPEGMSFHGGWGDVSLVYIEAACWMFGMLDSYEERGEKKEGPRGEWTHVVNLSGTDLGLWPNGTVDAGWLKEVRNALVAAKRGARCLPLPGPAADELTFVGFNTPWSFAVKLVRDRDPGKGEARVPDLARGEPWRMSRYIDRRLHRGHSFKLPPRDEVLGFTKPSRRDSVAVYGFREAPAKDAEPDRAPGGYAYQLPGRMRVLAPMRANPAYTQSTSQWHVLGRGFVLALLSDREMRGQLLGAWRTRPVPDEGYVTSAAGSLVFRRKLAVLDGNAPGIGPGGELCTKTLRYWGWNHKTSEEASFVEKVLRARRAYWKQDGGNWTLDTKAGNAAAKKETRAAAAADLGPEPSGGPLLTLAARKLVDSRSACALMELVTGSNGRCAELAVPARERPADFACGRLAKTMEIMGLDPGTIKEVPRWEGFGGMDCAR